MKAADEFHPWPSLVHLFYDLFNVLLSGMQEKIANFAKVLKWCLTNHAMCRPLSSNRGGKHVDEFSFLSSKSHLRR